MNSIRVISAVAILLTVSFLKAVPVFSGEEISGSYNKYDSQGKVLSSDAAEWDIVHDITTDLYWEVKRGDDSIHNKDDVYKWSKAKKIFVAKLNEEKFGGFSDWRMPTSDELRTIVKTGEEPYIDLEFFPNTVPANYLSWMICGSGEMVIEKVKFGTTKHKGKKVFVRAVRGGSSN